MTVKFKNHLKAFGCTAGLLLLISAAVSAQEPLRIKYWLAMPHPTAHLFEVTIEVELPDDLSFTSLDFQMAKWSPGRYAVFDFAKNVQEVKAREACQAGLDCTMPESNVTRMDDQTWRVDIAKNRHASMSLMFSYKVFANDLSGTFSQLDSRHANLNGGCVFMYLVKNKKDLVGPSINAPKSWWVVDGRTEKKDQ